jgi:beta-glucosidase
MELLKSAFDLLPRKFRRSPGPGSEQVILSTKKVTAATLLCAACSLQTGSGVSELPYYGRSPPVYPSRKVHLSQTSIAR